MKRSWRNALIGGGALLAVAGMAMWTVAARPASGAGTAEISIAPASMNQPLNGGSFTVDVKAENVENLGAFEFVVKFDKQKLTYEGLAGSGWLGSSGRRHQCFPPSFGPNGENSEEAANVYGAIHYGCTSNGLISGGTGIAGPSGASALATLQFKPKATGKADVVFVGMTTNYVIWNTADAAEGGQTHLTQVEVCTTQDGCAEAGIDADVQNGVVNVYDPNAPTPTGVPATPTRTPREPTPNTQATVNAALGTPTRGRTPVPGASQGQTGTIGGQPGSGASGSGGSSAGGGAAGSSGSGADGAPLAGHGPQGGHDPLPARTGIALTVAGLGLAGAGLVFRRRSGA